MPTYELDSKWFEFPCGEDQSESNNEEIDGPSNKDAKKHDGHSFIPKSLVKLRILGSTKSIPASAFSNQPKLTYLEIQDGVESIGDYAFYRCPYLFELHCPLSMRDIGVYAFAQATLLTEVTLPSDGKLPLIPASAFEYCESLLSVTVPASVKSIHHYAFFHCTSLAQIEFETTDSDSATVGGLMEIHDHAFGTCTSLKEVQLPASLIKLFRNAFCDCVKLQDVNIQEGLRTIEKGTFNGCSSLRYLEIPSSVEEFNKYDIAEGCHSRLKLRQRNARDGSLRNEHAGKRVYSLNHHIYQSTSRNVSAATMRLNQSLSSSIRASIKDDDCFSLCSIM